MMPQDSRTQAEQPLPRPVVLYDGSCPMCSREIAHYRRFVAADRLDWVDITRDPERLTRLGVDPAQAMARFHVRNSAGEWQTGAWGFAEMWSHLPGYRQVARLLRCSGLLPLTDRAYQRFAAWRLARRCADGICAGNKAN